MVNAFSYNFPWWPVWGFLSTHPTCPAHIAWLGPLRVLLYKPLTGQDNLWTDDMKLWAGIYTG